MDNDCTAGEYRDDSEAWYRVVAEPGVELLEGPNADGPKMLEMYLTGKVMYLVWTALTRLYDLSVVFCVNCTFVLTLPYIDYSFA